MKRILITGANSYIGRSVENWLMKEPNKYQVDTVDMRGEEWKEKDFSIYDVVFHVAGIAHIKETKKNKGLYYKVNRDLAYEAAKKAKNEGVKQFIFLSSMSVYGLEAGVIDENTPCKPKSAYGKSKLEAEELIRPLENDVFKIVILRPPMIYGKGCKGNYQHLQKIALKFVLFPKIYNRRSMLFIDNLSQWIKQLIDNYEKGVFFPQNTEYVCTSEMVKMIAKSKGKKVVLSKILALFIKIVSWTKIYNKIFGNLIYTKDLSRTDCEMLDFKKSIIKTVL